MTMLAMTNAEIGEVAVAVSCGKKVEAWRDEVWKECDFSGMPDLHMGAMLFEISRGFRFRVKPDDPPKKREVKYAIRSDRVFHVFDRTGQTRNITKAPGMVGFKCYEFKYGVRFTLPVYESAAGRTEVAKYVVFEE